MLISQPALLFSNATMPVRPRPQFGDGSDRRVVLTQLHPIVFKETINYACYGNAPHHDVAPRNMEAFWDVFKKTPNPMLALVQKRGYAFCISASPSTHLSRLGSEPGLIPVWEGGGDASPSTVQSRYKEGLARVLDYELGETVPRVTGFLGSGLLGQLINSLLPPKRILLSETRKFTQLLNDAYVANKPVAQQQIIPDRAEAFARVVSDLIENPDRRGILHNYVRHRLEP